MHAMVRINSRFRGCYLSAAQRAAQTAIMALGRPGWRAGPCSYYV